MNSKSFVTEEKERLIPPVVSRQDDRPAYITTELILAQERLPCAGRGECVRGVESVIAQVLPKAAMELIGTRFCDGQDDAAASPSIFCAVAVGKDSEFLQCVNRREVLTCIGDCVRERGPIQH